MRPRWYHLDLEPVPLPPPVAARVSDPLGARLLSLVIGHQGLTNEAEILAWISAASTDSVDPSELPDLDKAAALILNAIQRGKEICIWGDFDVDGQTSTVLLVDALAILGAKIREYVPDRASEGHGLNEAGIRMLANDGVDLVVTCDTGVANEAEIRLAARLGMEVLVTDHHELPERLPPDAVAVVNPRRLRDEHPLAPMCGVGVAYKLVEKLFALTGRGGEEEQFLDLVAMGTVADVALLTGENRRLVSRGLPGLVNQPRTGIRALFEVAKYQPTEVVTTEVVGFTIGPRLNAAGRLAHASLGISVLSETDKSAALRFAHQLETLNRERKKMTELVTEQAQEKLRDQPFTDVIILDDHRWHPGVIGIVASRLVETYDRPVVMISTSDGRVGRASCRSVKGLHIQDALSQHADLLLGGGGHAMAAGFTIPLENIAILRRRLQDTVDAMIDQDQPAGIPVLAEVDPSELTLDTVKALALAGPFGAGNPEPTLVARSAEIQTVTGIGGDAHSRLKIGPNGVGAVWWRKRPEEVPSGPVDLLFKVQINTWNGRSDLQLMIADAIPVTTDGEVRALETRRPVRRSLVDWRKGGLTEERWSHLSVGAVDDAARVSDVTAGYKAGSRAIQPIALLCEGPSDACPKTDAYEANWTDRNGLLRTEALVLGSLPPSYATLQDLLDRTGASTIYLTTDRLTETRRKPFLEQLISVARPWVKSGDPVTLAQIAARLGHTESTVLAGLDLLEKFGRLEWSIVDADHYRLSPASNPPAKDLSSKTLDHLLQETAAFQRYFLRDPAAAI